MMEGGRKFLKESQIKAEAKKWQEQANTKERPTVKLKKLDDSVYDYVANRIDTKGKGHIGSIDYLHNISFIGDVIPKLIANNPDRKVRILDVGAGMTVFTNQIRTTFGDKVKVFSTGLSKQAYKSESKLAASSHQQPVEKSKVQLHPNDLKWRSIRELSDFEEFDLIVDTYGEFAYSHSPDMRVGPIEDWEFEKVFEYISIVCRKLNPGGLASLAPVSFNSRDTLEHFEHNLRQASETFGVSFDMEPVDMGGENDIKYFTLRIRKRKREVGKQIL